MTTVLIVDDDCAKAIVLQAALLDVGIQESNVVIAQSVSEARRTLGARRFDVMLLDVLIPSRENELPRGDFSVDFLREIREDGTLSPPPFVLAITAESKALEEYEDDFRALTTQILLVQDGHDAWRESLKSLIQHVRASATSIAAFDYDVCFQTALRSPELSALVNHCGVSWGAEKILAPGLLVQHAIVNWAGRPHRIACAHADQMGMVAATHLSEMLIQNYKPRVLAMTGICGGVGDDVDFGDVVVADKTWDWQSGKWVDGRLASAPDQRDACGNLVARARAGDTLLQRLHAEYSGVKPGNQPRLHVSPMASGSAVVADPEFHKLFREQHRKVSAVDMECYGLYFAGTSAPLPRPQVICVKSVSDLADKTKEDDFQAFCSWISARFMLDLLERHFVALTVR